MTLHRVATGYLDRSGEPTYRLLGKRAQQLMVAHAPGPAIDRSALSAAEAQVAAHGEELLKALEELVSPNAPSADDLMLLFLSVGVTSAQQEKFRPVVEKLRAAQDAAREVIKRAREVKNED